MKNFNFKKLDITDKETVKKLFLSVFTISPWYDDWSNENQLNAYLTDLMGQSNSLTYGLFENDNLNTLEPDAELRLTIMSGIAQDESRKISERVSFGFKKSIERGIVLGNDAIWGYKKENGKLVIVPDIGHGSDLLQKTIIQETKAFL